MRRRWSKRKTMFGGLGRHVGVVFFNVHFHVSFSWLFYIPSSTWNQSYKKKIQTVKIEHVKRLDSVFRLGPLIFEHLLITIREGAPHKQAKAIFPDGSCRSFQITAQLARNKTPESSPIPPTSPA